MMVLESTTNERSIPPHNDDDDHAPPESSNGLAVCRWIGRLVQEVHYNYVHLRWFGFVVATSCAPSTTARDNDGVPDATDDDYCRTTTASLALCHAFGPSHAGICLIKALLFAWGFSLLSLSIYQANELFWIAYMTHWTLIVAVVYQFCSLCLSVHSFRWQKMNSSGIPSIFSVEAMPVVHHSLSSSTTQDNMTSMMVVVRPQSPWLKCFWVLFSLAIVEQTTVAVLFWTFDYNPEYHKVSYLLCMVHGGLTLLVGMDGFLMNQIPIRFRHIWASFLYTLLYTGWSLIHDLVLNDRTNPLSGNPDHADDDRLYASWSWKEEPVKTFIMLMASLLLSKPMAMMGLWMVSRVAVWMRQYCCCCRHDHQPSKTMHMPFPNNNNVNNVQETQHDDDDNKYDALELI